MVFQLGTLIYHLEMNYIGVSGYDPPLSHAASANLSTRCIMKGILAMASGAFGSLDNSGNL